MSINFFDDKYKEPVRTDDTFGLCDDQNSSKAYSDISSLSKWIATVLNKNNVAVTFTPIDYNIIIYKEGTQDKQSTCDGMLTFTDSLYFVELKDKQGSWIPEAISQLESTINIFKTYHNIARFKHKKAFACNKQRKPFQEIDNEQNLRFFRSHKFRLHIGTEIRL